MPGAGAERTARAVTPRLRVKRAIGERFADAIVGAPLPAVGTVYATNLRDEQVVTLAAGWKTQTVLPITDVDLTSIAVDARGNVYVTDVTDRQVVKLAAGAKTQTVLPFTNLQKPVAIAVDAVGNVYVSDFEANQVVMLPVV